MLNSFIRDVGCQILARSYGVLELVHSTRACAGGEQA